MSRFSKKGDDWRNSEDEVLKAAVMKYGRNHSSRVASLFHRKSAKQCKARWNEWLDPAIKKIEWSVEEDEKLLHLAKLMPSQWSTIAPIIGGRTATQCVERFEFLLHEGQTKQGDDDSSDLRKLKPSKLDPNLESKPALPDAKNMDQDELEMLAETRARLANTQGKKAKKKAYEKHIVEATRLAARQKKNELKAAEILVEHKHKKKPEMNYNTTNPFEKKPTPGFYNISDEQINSISSTSLVISNSHQQDLLNDKDNRIIGSKVDNEKVLPTKKKELPNSNTTAEESSRKRNKLVLPEPQISDTEIRKVTKLRKIFEHFDGLS